MRWAILNRDVVSDGEGFKRAGGFIVEPLECWSTSKTSEEIQRYFVCSHILLMMPSFHWLDVDVPIKYRDKHILSTGP